MLAVYFLVSPRRTVFIRKRKHGSIQPGLAGLGAGTTEAVVVVTPMEVVKIRLQAQQHSLADPLEIPRYRNAGHAVYTIVREEGLGALYRGVSLTALRQATNQGMLLLFALYVHFFQSAYTDRRQFHCLPGNKEIGASPATRLDRLAILPAHGYRTDFRRNGSILKCAYRHDQNPYACSLVINKIP